MRLTYVREGGLHISEIEAACVAGSLLPMLSLQDVISFLNSRRLLWPVPALLAHAIVLFRSERLWMEKVIVYFNGGMSARDVPPAHPILFMLGACVSVYWLSFIPGEYLFALIPRHTGIRIPSDTEKGCILIIVRILTLCVLYGGLFFLY